MKKTYKNIFIIYFLNAVILAAPLALLAADGNPAPATPALPWAWIFTRAAGIVGYILLSALTLSGLGIKTGLSYKFIDPVPAWIMHKYLGISTAFAILVHLISLLLDPFLKFSLYEILVPFASGYKSAYVALGIMGFYMFVAVIFSSLFLFMKPYLLWRLLHYLPYPIFVVIFLHGIFTGTDSSVPFMVWLYWITGLLVAAMSSYRIYLSLKRTA